jgi:hypothetical protein
MPATVDHESWDYGGGVTEPEDIRASDAVRS